MAKQEVSKLDFTNDRVSTMISSQLPMFVRMEDPYFVSFMEAYYKFLESKLVEIYISSDTPLIGDMPAGEVISTVHCLLCEDGSYLGGGDVSEPLMELDAYRDDLNRLVRPARINGTTIGSLDIDNLSLGSNLPRKKILLNHLSGSIELMASALDVGEIFNKTLLDALRDSANTLPKVYGTPIGIETPINAMNNLSNYNDIDYSFDYRLFLGSDYYTRMLKEIMPFWPNQLVSPTEERLKSVIGENIKDFYKSKGTLDSIKFIFRAIYGEEIEIFIPSDHMFYLNDGRWSTSKKIKAQIDAEGDLLKIANRVLYDSANTAYFAYVETVNVDPANNEIAIIELSNVYGSFGVGTSISGTLANQNTFSCNVISGSTSADAFGGNDAYAVCSSNGVLVAVGSAGKCATSSDNGVTWTARPSFTAAFGSESTGWAVCWNGSVFVAVGYVAVGVYSACATSSDGVTWTARPSYTAAFGANNAAWDVCWNGSVFVAVGDYSACATSSDGVTWTSRPSLATAFDSNYAYAVCSINGVLVAVGGGGKCATSSDGGVTWTARPSFETAFGSVSDAYAVCSNGSLLVAVGAGGKCATSSDGITWTARPSFETAFGSESVAYDVCWNGSVFVAVGYVGVGVCATSSDGVTWTSRPSLVTALAGGDANAVCWNGSLLVAVGTSGKCVTSSDDGVTWTSQSGLIESSQYLSNRGILNGGPQAPIPAGHTTWDDPTLQTEAEALYTSDNTDRIQDDHYYQLFSYVVRTNLPESEYPNIRETLKKLVHPAGWLLFIEAL